MDPRHQKPTEQASEQLAEATESNSVPQPPIQEKPLPSPDQEYAKRMGNFISYYNQLLIVIATVALLGVVIAIARDVLIGGCVSVLAAVLYVYFTSDELFKKLGLQYRSSEDGILITRCRMRYGDTLYVPQTLIGLDVTAIAQEAFQSKKNTELRCLYLPKTLKMLSCDLDVCCPGLCELHFGGSMEEWEKVVSTPIPERVTLFFDAEYPTPIRRQKANRKHTDKA